MAYKFFLSPRAEQHLSALDVATVKRILRKISWISKQAHPLSFTKRLSDPVIGDVRFRIGDYRAIAVVHEKRHEIVIVAIGHRREIYRR